MRLVIFAILCASLALTSPAYAQSTKPQPLGDCVWAQLPPDLWTEFLAAYRQNTSLGMSVLQKHDAAIGTLIDKCVGRRDIPRRLTRAAVGSQAIQNGATAELSSHGISADMLDATWKAAPDAARQCTRANAAKIFGLMNEPCPREENPLWLVHALKISPQTNRPAAAQALMYFNATAQEEWAEALLAKLREAR